MVSCDCWPSRREFLRSASAFAVTLPTFAASAPTEFADEPKESDTIVGPKKGFSPQIGTLTSMMPFTRTQVPVAAKGLSTGQLDFLLDGKAERSSQTP